MKERETREGGERAREEVRESESERGWERVRESEREGEGEREFLGLFFFGISFSLRLRSYAYAICGL
jgi:hypothetical protein